MLYGLMSSLFITLTLVYVGYKLTLLMLKIKKFLDN